MAYRKTDANSAMKCHGCSTSMILDKQETGPSSCTQWHSCPLCGKVRLTSQPETNLSADHHERFYPNDASTSSQEIASGNPTFIRKGTPYFA